MIRKKYAYSSEPDAVLEDRARQIAELPDADGRMEVSMVRVRARKIDVVIPAALIYRVVFQPEIMPVPGSEEYLLGLINVDGRIAAVIDPSRLITGVPGSHAVATVLLEDPEGGLCGLGVDEPPVVLRATLVDVPCDQAEKQGILAVCDSWCESEGRILPVISLSRLFSFPRWAAYFSRSNNHRGDA